MFEYFDSAAPAVATMMLGGLGGVVAGRLWRSQGTTLRRTADESADKTVADAFDGASTGLTNRGTDTATRPIDSEAMPLPRALDADRGVLAFNARVLQLACDPDTPLVERVRYLRIVEANLDDFFASRFARRIGQFDATVPNAPDERAAIHRIERDAQHLSDSITVCANEIAREMMTRGSTPLGREHLNAVDTSPACGVPVVPHGALATPIVWVAEANTSIVLPDRVPMATGTLRLVNGLRAYVFAPQSSSDPASIAFGRPASIVTTADIAQQAFPEILAQVDDRRLSGAVVEYAGVVRVTYAETEGVRAEEDATTSSGNTHADAPSTTMCPVRVEMSSSLPAGCRDELAASLRPQATDRDEALLAVTVVSPTPALSELQELAGALEMRSVTVDERASTVVSDAQSVWEWIRREDRLLHHPYEDFTQTVVRVFTDAADDPDVECIRVVLYRLGETSVLVEALERAARNGKRVCAAIELRARGDESRNRAWAKRLRDAGVCVVHGPRDLKNHAKAALIERREGTTLRRYAHIATGNYNATTAQSYTDIGLFTANEVICRDLADCFDAIMKRRSVRKRMRACLVGPEALRTAILHRIDREIDHARRGRPASIRMKMNGLADRECIEALYRASQAGVSVELIVRGLCTLRPNVPEVSEHIRVVSIIGRYLEHGRIYAFANDGDPEYFIGSADLRPRNMRRRIELLVPVASPALQARLNTILITELQDPTAWSLQADGRYLSPAIRALQCEDSAQRQFAAWHAVSHAVGG